MAGVAEVWILSATGSRTRPRGLPPTGGGTTRRRDRWARAEGTCVLQTLDSGGARRWAVTALAALGEAREEIDALNVFPVPDGDTGTNLFLTLEAAVTA